MRILDLRPGLVRRFNRVWDRPPAGTAGLKVARPGAVARVVGRVTDRVIRQRVAQRPAPPSTPYLVSVGNLAVGGTGKTPVVMGLARALAGRGRRGAVLTRGFGSSLKGPLVVAGDNPGAGDEARLMAGKLADLGWPVVQARGRPEGLAFIQVEFPQLDYVLLEDAHQTNGLPRHLDILLLDSWDVDNAAPGAVLCPQTGPVFPFGAWRESARGAERAGILLVETDQQVPARGKDGQVVATFQRHLTLCHAQGQPLDRLPAAGYALLSGIARPAVFERMVHREVGRPAELSIRCRDHARYDPGLMRRITAALEKAGTKILLTTFKDWVKLAPLAPDGITVVLVELDVVWGQPNALPQLVEERLEFLE